MVSGVVLLASIFKAVAAYILTLLFGVRTALLIVNTLTWPGVVLHETSHAVAGLLTGAKIHKFSVLPQGNTLGHVITSTRGNFILRGIQQACTGIAPAVVCPTVAYFLLNLKVESAWLSILRYYMVVCCILHCELSGADISVVIRGIPAVVILLCIIRFIFLCKGSRV